MPRFKTVRGMRDLLPSDAQKLRRLESLAREISELYSYEEVITPLVEHYALMDKSGTEIKTRMYTFEDLGGRRVVLRPEFTASIARLMATTLRNQPKPVRLFSTGTLYRYDEPQFGRYREFWQSNFEIIGSERPEADVEILSLTNQLMKEIGLRNYWLKIGHVGLLRGLLSTEGMSAAEQNTIMQLLDKKLVHEAIKQAESTVSTRGISALKQLLQAKGDSSSKFFKQVEKPLKGYKNSLNALNNLERIITLCKEGGIKFRMSIEPGFARGLEYYTGMIFEVLTPELEISLGGGGRYDRLIEHFGGEATPAVGVAHGLDRIALALDKQESHLKQNKKVVAVIPINAKVIPQAINLTQRLREEGIHVMMEIMGRRVSTAIQDASRRKIAYALILGPDELEKGKISLRDMKRREQKLVDYQTVHKTLTEELTN